MQFTLLLTLVLVVLVIFLFLRNLPATVIPSLALPVSLVGTFGLMAALGYSLDNLSLMALTLAVGFVVDDAIVMLENIVRHMERGEPPLEAAFRGSKEIAFTILSMTISLAAVFLPILFMGGLVGRLFEEFAVTIGAAILVSGLRLAHAHPAPLRALPEAARGGAARPALPRHRAGVRARRCASTTAGLTWALDHPRSVLAFSGVVLVLMVPLWRAVPKGFLPSEDTGRLVVNTEAGGGDELGRDGARAPQRWRRSRPRTRPSSHANSDGPERLRAVSCSCGSRTATGRTSIAIIQDLRRDLGRGAVAPRVPGEPAAHLARGRRRPRAVLGDAPGRRHGRPLRRGAAARGAHARAAGARRRELRPPARLARA